VKLWRVSDFVDLSGQGGRLVRARWHSAGRSILYTAEHSALALLESLVHLEIEDEAPTYQLLELDAPDSLEITTFPESLPPISRSASRAWGDAWLAEGKTPLALVPSIIAPDGRNLLINPGHDDAARIRIVRHARYEWDPRLFARS
jgi:RES domain-containing protein